MPRLFFALQPQPAEQAAILTALLPLVHALGARSTPQADLHLTLAFLGEVPADAMPVLQHAAADAATGPFALQLCCVDYWARPGVLCLLPEETAISRSIRQLARTLGDAAQIAGKATDDKPFRPHVTVARKVPRVAPQMSSWPQPLRTPLPFTAHGFVLMESTSQQEGPRYKVIHSWPSRSGE